MPFVKVMIHTVWGTKCHKPFFTGDVKPLVIQHIKENARTKEIYIDTLNGHADHLHCLFGLNADMSLAKAIQLMKGEVSFWINKQKITQSNFEWGDEYFAVSVSESGLAKVRAYIQNQEDHHKKITFAEEYGQFLKAYGMGSQG